MTDPRNIIPAGPGFVGPIDAPNEYSADVELELVYAPEHDTVASLILRATNVDGAYASQGMGVELTYGDLVALAGWIDSMLAAAGEDA